MAYSVQQLEHLNRECRMQAEALQTLNFEGLAQSNMSIKTSDWRVAEYLRHGVGRRLGVLKRSLEEVFRLFPPAQERPIGHDRLVEVQIYLHAFVINLAGTFDNWAWAFVLRHELLEAIGGRMNVGLFKSATQRFLPVQLREYVTSSEIDNWQSTYLKGYRDALAHRIPLYIPPAAWTSEDSARYDRLEQEKVECILNSRWERLDAVWAEQDAVGSAYPVFMHSFAPEERAQPIYLHPQMLCDSATVVEMGKRFYSSWHEAVR